MKKFAFEAEELLSKAELYEIKAGGNPDSGDSGDDDDDDSGDCWVCSTCISCSTCKVCQTRMMDVIIVP